MKKHWQRGVLLGVSIALLLAGGVALAQGSLSVDKECVNCVPEKYWNVPWEDIPYELYGFTITGEGWTSSPKCYNNADDMTIIPMDMVYHELRWPNGDVWYACPELAPDGSFVWGEGGLMWSCEVCSDDLAGAPYEAGISDGVDCVPALGEMEYYFEDTTGGASVFVLLAEDCPEAEAEFVPEAGTLLLFSSGLAGLGGYATLRLRSGQALHWRVKE